MTASTDERLDRAARQLGDLPVVVPDPDAVRRRRRHRAAGVGAATLAVTGLITALTVTRGDGSLSVTDRVPADPAPATTPVTPPATSPVDATTPPPTPAPSAPPSPAGWRTLPAPPLAPRSDALAVWTGAEVLVLGGEPQPHCPPNADCALPEGAALGDGAAFDPVTGRWRTIAEAPAPVTGAARVAVAGDAVYVLAHPATRAAGDGGFFRYEPAADTWAAFTPPDHSARYDLVGLGDGVVAFPTSDEREPLPDLRFEPDTGAWSTLPDDPLGPSYERSLVGVAGRLHLFAKDLVESPNSSGPSLVRTAEFDPATGEWSVGPDSELIGGWGAVVVADRVVFPQLGGADGGAVDNWGRTYPYGGIYDTTRRAWSDLPERDPAVLGVGAIGTADAGYTGWAGAVLDIDAATWIDVPPLPDERSGPWGGVARRAVTAAGQALFVYGGEFWSSTHGQLLGDAYWWTPPATEFCTAGVAAAEGRGGLGRLTGAPQLDTGRRNRVAAVVTAAQRDLAGGHGWDNSELVALVNEVCGLALTPATMVP